VKGGDVSLFGSKARLRWTEMGERQLTYGIEGAPKQPKLILTAERWGYHPTYPTGIPSGKAVTSTHITGYAPKQIPASLYFQTTRVPKTSHFFDWDHFFRPTTKKPVKTPPIKPASPGIAAVSPVSAPILGGIVSSHMPELQLQRIISPKPSAKVAYAEPSLGLGGVRVTDAGLPVLQPQRTISPKPSAKVAYADPPKPSPTLERILMGVSTPKRAPAITTKPKTTLNDIIGAIHPLPTPTAATIPKHKKTEQQAKTPSFALDPEPATAPSTQPFTWIAPTPFSGGAWQTPTPTPVTILKTPPITTLDTETKGAGEPPSGIGTMAAMPPLPPMIIPPSDKSKKRKKRKTPKKRGMFAWEVKNPIRAFFGTPAEDTKELQSILGIAPTRTTKK
jgi:hypothetical protein